MSYSKAAQAYQKKNDENLSPLQIIVELYKGMIKHTKDAKSHWAAGRFEEMSNSILKVFSIIEVLQSHLDLEQGGEDAAFLYRFYNVIFSALTMVNLKPAPGEEFDSIITYMQQVTDRWYAIAYPRVPEAEHSESQAAI